MNEIIREQLRIKVKASISMLHMWSNAPEGPQEFLKNSHRHVFKVRVILDVNHEDRDIEFFELQNNIKTWLSNFKSARDNTDFSCEVLAMHVRDRVIERYGDGNMEIEVSEDGENAAILVREIKTVK